MPNYTIEFKSGESYDVDAISGDEAKRKAYELALKAHPDLNKPEDAGHPSRAVARVIHPER